MLRFSLNPESCETRVHAVKLRSRREIAGDEGRRVTERLKNKEGREEISKRNGKVVENEGS